MNHAQSHPHVVVVPRWILFVHIAQVLLALIVLGLVSYSLHVYNFVNDAVKYEGYASLGFPIFGSWSLNIFTVIFTWIVIAYIELSSRLFPAIYNMWAAATLEILAAIFWLCSFASLATDIANTLLFTCGGVDSFGNISDCTLAPRNSSAAAAGLGGLLFVLFLITAGILALHTFRHYKSARTTGQHDQAPYAGQPNEMQNGVGISKPMNGEAGVNGPGDTYSHSGNQGYNSQTPNMGYTQPSNIPNQGTYNQPETMHNQPPDVSNHAAYQPPKV